MPSKRNTAPVHLSEASAEWWLAVQEDYELEPHHNKLLGLACEAFDRCQQAREMIDAEGPVTQTADGTLKTHPAVAVERDNRLAFARLLRELDLDTEPANQPSRPPALRWPRHP